MIAATLGFMPLAVLAFIFLKMIVVPGFTLSSAALAPEESEAPLHVKGAYGEMITSNCSTVSGSSKSKLTNFAAN